MGAIPNIIAIAEKNSNGGKGSLRVAPHEDGYKGVWIGVDKGIDGSGYPGLNNSIKIGARVLIEDIAQADGKILLEIFSKEVGRQLAYKEFAISDIQKGKWTYIETDASTTKPNPQDAYYQIVFKTNSTNANVFFDDIRIYNMGEFASENPDAMLDDVPAGYELAYQNSFETAGGSLQEDGWWNSTWDAGFKQNETIKKYGNYSIESDGVISLGGMKDTVNLNLVSGDLVTFGAWVYIDSDTFVGGDTDKILIKLESSTGSYLAHSMVAVSAKTAMGFGIAVTYTICRQ